MKMRKSKWHVSDQDKGRSFLNSLVIFILLVLIILVVGATIYLLYTNKPELFNNITSNKVVNENKTTLEDNEDEDKDVVIENNDNEEEKKTENKSSSVSNVEAKRYSIENKDFFFEGEDKSKNLGIKLYEYDNTNKDYAEMYFRLDSYSTESSYSYVIEVKSDGNNLLLNDRGNSVSEREVTGGVVSSVKLDKESIGDEIEINIKEMNAHSSKSRTVERTAVTTLTLNSDLEEIELVELEDDIESYTLEDIEFKTYKNDDVDKNTYPTSSASCLKTNYSIGISTQYGNRMVQEENIQFYVVDNVNGLNLDNAFDIETKIAEKIGEYGILDMYKVNVSNGTGDVTTEHQITFEDMKNIVAGDSANSNKKKITAQDIVSDKEKMVVASSSKITLPNKIRAYEYTYRQDPTRTHYMFILNNRIYYISVPNDERYEENVDLFMNSLKEK